jgi:hypothetical protein
MTRPRDLVAAALVAVLLAPGAGAQTRRVPAKKPAPPPAAEPRTEPAMVKCPQVLGDGVRTKRQYCEVLIGNDPAQGILVSIPPHTGPTTLLFDLHNRLTYSEEAVKANRAYQRFTASTGVLTLDNTLISRAVIQSEFRTQADLVDRVSGGSGPGGVKAVAPTGTEAVAMALPADVMQVSILGEKLSVVRVDGVDDFRAQGRPIALVSNIQVEYRPGPTKPAPAAPPKKRK